MSGPIVRSYGVPNWDDIFGRKNEDDKRQNESRGVENAQASDKPPEKAAQAKDVKEGK